jgi:hypothetical protein
MIDRNPVALSEQNITCSCSMFISWLNTVECTFSVGALVATAIGAVFFKLLLHVGRGLKGNPKFQRYN